MTRNSARLLLALVFVAGMASLGVEFGASRLLAPYFGTSLYVWGILIGLILVYLSAGYVIGGRLADRHPRADLLFQITACAGAWICLVPLVSYPILRASLQGFASVNAGLVLSTLLAVILLFAVPVVLLGCVSPFAIRLLLKDVQSGGNTAGAVYALSTAGSILGTFLPVFWFIPTYGTRPTLAGFGLVLLALSIAGLWPRRRGYTALLLVVALATAATPNGIKPPATGRLLYEKESAYNYIQVVQTGSTRELILNEGQAVHSVFDPHSTLTGGYWDYFLLASSFRPAAADEHVPARVALLGMAGGTVARQISVVYGGRVEVQGVEIDPDIVAAGRRYFALDQPGVHPVVDDARHWLEVTRGRYDVIGLDAYRQPYIPFHLTTREFFAEARDHLTPDGVFVANVGRTATDYRLVSAIASTMHAVFRTVLLLDVPGYDNTLVYGMQQAVSVADVQHNLAFVREPLIKQVVTDGVPEANIRVSPYHGQVFTDDLAPVERLVDSIIFDYVSGRH